MAAPPPSSPRSQNKMPDEPPILAVAPPRQAWKLLPVLTIAALVAAIVFVHQNEPVANKQYFPQCGFKKVTGLDCPGCGGLRATHALTHGRLLAAFQFHPGYILSLPIVGFLVFLWLREWRRRGEMPVPLAQADCNTPLVWIAVIFLALGVVRNIPVKPFSWLASPPVVEPAAEK
jgi:hypothetical protein